MKKLFTLLDLCVSSLRRGHVNLLCIVPILTDHPREESKSAKNSWGWLACLYETGSFMPATVWFSCLENLLCQVEAF